MKTVCTLLQITGLFLVAALPAAAQTQSYTVTVPASTFCVMLANQLNHGSSFATNVLANVSEDGETDLGISAIDGDVVDWAYSCDGGGYGSYTFDSTYTGPTYPPYEEAQPILTAGEGFIFFNLAGVDTTFTFTGTPNVPVLPVPLACGGGNYYWLGRQTNGVGTYENITGYAPAEGAQVDTLTGTAPAKFVTNTYTGGAWTLGTPSLAVGYAAQFFIPAGSAPFTNPISYSVTVPGSTAYVMLANQLNNGSNYATNVLANVTEDGETNLGISAIDGDEAVFYQCGSHYTYTFDSEYTGPPYFGEGNPVLMPGEGFALINLDGNNTTFTFTGTPVVPVLPVPLSCGQGNYYWLGAQTNEIGTYENITGYTPVEGAQVDTLASGGDFVTNTFSGGIWTLGTPSLPVGYAAQFFIPTGSVPVVPVIPTLGKVSLNHAGAVQFSINGIAGVPFRVWATTNLVSGPVTNIWTQVVSGEFSTSAYDFTDAAAANFPQRFYTVTVP